MPTNPRLANQTTKLVATALSQNYKIHQGRLRVIGAHAYNLLRQDKHLTTASSSYSLRSSLSASEVIT